MKTDLVEIFQTIRADLQPYTTNGFTARVNSETNYELWSEKAMNAEGEKIEAVFFVGIKIQKGFVGLYFTPIMHEPQLKDTLPAALLSLLEDESCFHIKELDDQLMEQIDDALVVGFTHFKQKGWV